MGSYETNVSSSPAVSYKYKSRCSKNKNKTFTNINSIKTIKNLLRIYVCILKCVYIYIYKTYTGTNDSYLDC